MAVDEIGDAIRLPECAEIVEGGRRVRHLEVESAALDALRFRDPPMRRHRDLARPLPAAFHDIDLRRPAAIIGEHPERRPHADADRYLGADFEVSVFLGKPALRRQDSRDIFIVEQHGFQRRRGPAGDDRENAVLDLERIEAERRRFPPAIARIDIDLLLAVPAGFAPEVGAVAAPIARFRPGRVAGVMRGPSLVQQGMGVEIVVEGPVQRYRSQRGRLQRFDAAAFLAEDGGRGLQRELARRAGEIGLRECRDGGGRAPK